MAGEALAPEAGRSLWQDAWARMRKNRMAVFGAIALAIIAAASLIGPLVIAHGYEEQNLLLGAAPPSAAHPLGTDKLGRDQLARILYGGRVSLLVGIAATAVSLTIGTALFYAALIVVLNLVVDIVQMWINPKQRAT